MTPRVSVVTPVFNGARFLREAAASIRAQSYTDLEHIFVDDGSIDDTPAILRDLAAGDSRVRVHVHPENLGGSAAVNTGLQHAQGEFVAILDADDRARPERLGAQVAFLDAHPDVGVLGGQAETIDDAGKFVSRLSFPESDAELRWALLTRAPVLHSAAMMRRAVLVSAGGYHRDWRYANDYFLWRALMDRTAFANLPTVVADYRRHSTQESTARHSPQRGAVWMLQHSMYAERLGIRAPLQDIADLFDGIRQQQVSSEDRARRAMRLLAQLHERYGASVTLSPAARQAIDLDACAMLIALGWTHRRWTELRREIVAALSTIAPQWRTAPQLRRRIRELSASSRDRRRAARAEN